MVGVFENDHERRHISPHSTRVLFALVTQAKLSQLDTLKLLIICND